MRLNSVEAELTCPVYLFKPLPFKDANYYILSCMPYVSVVG